MPIVRANIRLPRTATLKYVKYVGIRDDGSGERNMGKETRGDGIKDDVCLFLFLKNKNAGVFVTYLRRLKGRRLDERDADKGKV